MDNDDCDIGSFPNSNSVYEGDLDETQINNTLSLDKELSAPQAPPPHFNQTHLLPQADWEERIRTFSQEAAALINYSSPTGTRSNMYCHTKKGSGGVGGIGCSGYINSRMGPPSGNRVSAKLLSEFDLLNGFSLI